MDNIELKIGTPVTIFGQSIKYGDYYYLGKGVVGYMNPRYFDDGELFFVPSFNIFHEKWIIQIAPSKLLESVSMSNPNFLKGNVIDVDSIDDCLYTKEGFEWWNEEQKKAIRELY